MNVFVLWEFSLVKLRAKGLWGPSPVVQSVTDYNKQKLKNLSRFPQTRYGKGIANCLNYDYNVHNCRQQC